MNSLNWFARFSWHRVARRCSAVGITLLLFLVPRGALAAKLQADLIDVQDNEARFIVSWEAGTWTSGGLYTDTKNRANKKIVKKSADFCDEQGFDRWRFATLGEIAKDDTLRVAWDIATGGTGKTHSTERTGNWLIGVEKHNRVRRILILSKVEDSRGPCKEIKVPILPTAKPEAQNAEEVDNQTPQPDGGDQADSVEDTGGHD